MPGIVHRRTHQHIHTDIGSNIFHAGILLGGMYPAQQDTALCHNKSSRLGLEERRVTVFFHKIVDQHFKILLKGLHREILLIIQLVIRDTVTTTKIDELQFLKLHCDPQEILYCCQKRFRIHKKGSHMLVDAGDGQVILCSDLKDLIDILFRDRKLGLLTGRHHLFMMSGAYARIDTDRTFSALIDLAELLQLAQGVDAYHDLVIDGKLHLFF